MKDIIISEEVKNNISRLQKELFELCVANEVPMVACVILERKTELGEKTSLDKMLSCYLNGQTGAADSTILAASGILQRPEIPMPLAILLSGSLNK